MAVMDNETIGAVLPYDPEDWEQRLAKARAKRAKILARRRAEGKTAPDADRVQTLAEQLRTFRGAKEDLPRPAPVAAPAADQRPLATGNNGAQPANAFADPGTAPEFEDHRALAEALVRLRQSPAPDAGPLQAPADETAMPPSGQIAQPAPAAAAAAPARRGRRRTAWIVLGFLLGLVAGLPAAFVAARLVRPADVEPAIIAAPPQDPRPPAPAAPARPTIPPEATPTRIALPTGTPDAVPPARPLRPGSAPVRRGGAPTPLPPGQWSASSIVLATELPPKAAQIPEPKPPADPPGFPGIRVVVHVPASGAATSPGRVIGIVDGTGVGAVSRVRTPHTISRTHIRYYHEQDRPAAEAVAAAIGAAPRSFTSFSPKPPAGLVEVWLSGAGNRVLPRSARQSEAKTLKDLQRAASGVINNIISVIPGSNDR